MRAMVTILLHGLLIAGTPSPGVSGSGSALTSVYAISFHSQAGATLPSGATFVCHARIMPGVNAAQSVSRAAAGNESGCAMELPFAWAANHPQPVAVLSYEVDTISANGQLLRTAVREGVALPNAAPGVSARIDIAF
jgi:hypothetical protein